MGQLPSNVDKIKTGNKRRNNESLMSETEISSEVAVVAERLTIAARKLIIKLGGEEAGDVGGQQQRRW